MNQETEERVKALNLSSKQIAQYQKEFQELHITNDFMFGELISYPELAKLLLETVLKKKLDKVEVRTEESIELRYKHKEVRLDAYIKGTGEVYNIEMQVKDTGNLLKRCRSYEGKMDLENEKRGAMYDQLPDTYVIFICMESPLKGERPRYDVKASVSQDPTIPYEEGRHKIYLCPKHWEKEENLELRQFLRYVAEKVPEGNVAKQFQQKMDYVKSNQDLGVTFMNLKTMLYDERKLAREEGREEGKEEAREEAREERIKQAKMMLLDMDNEKISKYTGFSQEQIQKWRESEST